MNIVFWSSLKGKGATSGNMLAVGTMSAILYSLKTVLVQTDKKSKAIEEVFEGKKTENMINDEFYFYSKKGIDEIIDRGKMNIINDEIISTNLINVKHTNLFFIPSSHEDETNLSLEEQTSIYNVFMKELNGLGNINFWDISNGNSILSSEIAKNSDVLVINICQNSDYSKICINDEEVMKKAVFLVGRYDYASRENLYSICKKMGIKREKIGVIPYNIQFHDAINEGRLVPFIMKNIFSKKHDMNFEFINSLFKSTNLILKAAGVEGIGE